MRVRIDGTPDEAEAALQALDLVLDVQRVSRMRRASWRRGIVRVYARVLTVPAPTP